jgi:hypothetical protein
MRWTENNKEIANMRHYGKEGREEVEKERLREYIQ